MQDNTSRIQGIVDAHLEDLRTQRTDVLDSYKNEANPDWVYTEEALSGDLEDEGLRTDENYLEAMRRTVEALRADGVKATPPALR